MVKHSKFVYIIGSIIIGIITILGIIAGLILGGVIDGKSNKLVFVSGSVEKVYDGTELTCSEFVLQSGELKDGHVAHATITGTQTCAGTSENLFAIVILDGNGADVSGDYEIKLNPGVLTVSQRSIEITANSLDKVYDGEKLTCEEYTVMSGTLVEGHTLEPSYVGEIINVGQVDNQVSALIKDVEGNDVTTNYALTCSTGKLTVTPRPITIRSNDYDKTYDGKPLMGEASGYTIEEGEVIGEQQVVLTCGASQTNKGTTPNEVCANIFNGTEDLTNNYNITYLFGTLTVNPRRIEITSKYDAKEYDGKPLTCDEWDLTVGTIAQDQTLRVLCVGTITDVGTKPNSFTYEIKDKQNQEVSDNYIVDKVEGTLTVSQRLIHIKTLSADKVYDGTPLSKQDGWYVISGYELVQNQELVLEGYTSVTHVFEGRRNNILTFVVKEGGVDKTKNYNIVCNPGTLTVSPRPATVITQGATKLYDGTPLTNNTGIEVDGIINDEKWLVEATGSQTNAGESLNYYNIVVTNKNGVITTEDYDFTGLLGLLVVEKVNIKLISGSAEKPYDNTPLTLNEVEIVNGSLVQGETIKYYVTGSITNAGSVPNTFSYEIFKADGVNSSNINYNVTIEYGVLKVTQREITVITIADSKLYDGTPLTKDECSWSGDLLDGENIYCVVNGSITDVGTADNTVSVKIVKADGFTDSTLNYVINKQLGTLKVMPIKLTVITHDLSKTYDGTPLYGDYSDAEVTGNLATGHYYELSSTNAYQLEVGKTKNSVNVIIRDASGADKSHNYEIIRQFGNIEVLPIELIVTSGSASKLYNGQLQSYKEIDVLGQLLKNHKLVTESIYFPEGYIDVQEYVNVFDYTDVQIVDELTGEDVTRHYNITAQFGKFMIYPKPIEIRTHDAIKEYDGLPLTNDKITIAGQLIDGHELDVIVTGTITVPGETLNTFIVNGIIDTNSNGMSVMHNYAITSVFGKLVVLGQSNNAGSDNEGGNDGGGIGGASGSLSMSGNGKPKEVPLYVINSQFTDRIYLREKSFGDYTVSRAGSEWLDGVPYTSLGVNALNFNYLAAKNAIQSGSLSVKKVEESASFIMPYYSDLSLQSNYDDVAFAFQDSEYSIMFIPLGKVNNGSYSLSASQYASIESEYSNYVYINYTKLPTDTEEVMLKVIKEYGLSKDDPYIISKVASLVQGHVKYDFNYHYEGDIASYFFLEAKTGICQHYATAATALFRALDIPARYTVGFVTDAKSGVDTIVTSIGHAWVEVYVDGFGWVPVEVTGSGDGLGGGESGNSQQGDKALLIKPYNVYEKGSSSSVLTYNLTQLEGVEFNKLCQENGYTYTFNVRGSQIGVGKTVSTIENFVLYDADGNDITKQFNFNIKTGIIQVYLQEITVTTAGMTFVYDGQRHFANAEDAYFINYGESGMLMFGHEVSTVTMNASIIDVGSISNNISKFVITDADGNDVTNFYKINFVYGRLTVKAREITVTTAGKTATMAELNGQELFCHEYSITSTTGDQSQPLVDSHDVTATFYNTISTPSRVDNKATIKIVDGLGRDVTKNYSIKYVYGKLRITR